MLDVVESTRKSNSSVLPADQFAAASYLPTCAGCIPREFGACPGYGVKQQSGVRSVSQTFPSRRTILHQRELSDVVPVICSGWAATSLPTPHGKRQVVALLLAGDTASINYLFEPCSGRVIEAVSPVTCRKFRRADLLSAASRHPSFLSIVGKALTEERESRDQMNFDLGRRGAEARIAHFIHGLHMRMAKRGLAKAGSFEFPLRQQQIADALGLTAVHVCKVISRMRNARMIELEGRRLKILDPKALAFMADQ